MQHQIDNLQRGNLSEVNQFKWNGFYRARVLDSHDLRQLGRVKVHIPDLMPEIPPEGPDPTKEGLWAHASNNFLGGRNFQELEKIEGCEETMPYQGSCLIPPKGSWVWVFFENGEPNHPYYFASADWGQRKVLPENQNGPEWEKKWTLIKTHKGRCIIVSDDEEDCRVEITGRKRLMTNEPDGDPDSVFTIDGNQTTILLDEREGFEKLEIKDYRGNFIVLHSNNAGYMDQLHVFMQDDIHIETLKNFYIKTGLSFHTLVGLNYNRTVIGKTSTYSFLGHSETALNFSRLSFINDRRISLVKMEDYAANILNETSGITTNQVTGVSYNVTSGASIIQVATGLIHSTTMGIINQFATIAINSTTAGIINQFALLASNNLGLGTINHMSGGIINIHGLLTNIQCGALPAIPIIPLVVPIPSVYFTPSMIALPALPYGNRDQEPSIQEVVTSAVSMVDSELGLGGSASSILGEGINIINSTISSINNGVVVPVEDQEPLPTILVSPTEG